MAKTPGSRKAKGSRLEREFAKMIRDCGLDSHAQRMLLSGAGYLKGDIYTNLPLTFEVKNQENWSPLAWYRQAASQGKAPVVVMSRNHESIFCFMDADLFLEMIVYAKKGGWIGS